MMTSFSDPVVATANSRGAPFSNLRSADFQLPTAPTAPSVPMDWGAYQKHTAGFGDTGFIGGGVPQSNVGAGIGAELKKASLPPPSTEIPSATDLGTPLSERMKAPDMGYGITPKQFVGLSALSSGLQTAGAIQGIRYEEKITSNKLYREYADREFMQRYNAHLEKIGAVQRNIDTIKALQKKLGGSYAGQQSQLFE